MTDILIAEDEVMLRLLAVEMLEEAGFTVLQAGDGCEALDILKANPGIKVLVSDIRMPRMDGYALLEAGLGLRPDLKAILITGYAEGPPPALMAAHGVEILHKPFDLEYLAKRVAAISAP